MKDWYKLKPELFKKRPHYLPGCDAYLTPQNLKQTSAKIAENRSFILRNEYGTFGLMDYWHIALKAVETPIYPPVSPDT